MRYPLVVGGANIAEQSMQGVDARTLYSFRLQELSVLQSAAQGQERRLGYFKVATAFLGVLTLIILLSDVKLLWLLIGPVGLFVLLSLVHERRIRQIRQRQRSIQFFEGGIARLENRWAGRGERGERFLDPGHPYARDLDLFGAASVFELLCTARTRAGEEELAQWLLTPASLEEIDARHGAVRDLMSRVDLRERLFSAGETVRAGVNPDSLADWGDHAPILKGKRIRAVTTALGLFWVAGMIAAGVWGWGTLALALSALSMAWSHRIHARWDEAADRIEEAAHDLDVLADVLKLIEQGRFSAPRLQQIQTRLKHADFVPSDAIRRLDRIVGYLESRRNPALRLLDVLSFWSAQCVFLAEDWQQEFGPHIRGWLQAVGEFEALTALAGHAFEHPEDSFPKLERSGALFEAEGMAHPLLPGDKAVRNDVKLGDGLQLVVLSGPNMAGKSTFIRSIGVNAVLAQCGAVVRARGLRMSSLAVAASICILDSLSGGTSRFYAEIRRLKIAEDLTHGAIPVLFLLDELLSGTNSHDRLEGTKLIVRSMVNRGAIGIVSTHDLALAGIPDTMEGRAANFHFDDRLENDHLVFDYRLKRGVVQTSNALELMRSIGLGQHDSMV